MTRIGGQCKGCSRAYWESKRKKKTLKPDASSTAEREFLTDAGSDTPDLTDCEVAAFDDPARALQNAVSRIAEIETKLSAPNCSAVEGATVTASPVVDEHQASAHVSYDVLQDEKQMLKARINAIFRCVGLLESHEKVLKKVGHGSWGWRKRLQEALRRSYYFRSLPYYQVLLKLRYKLPGITDLLRFLDEIFSDEVSSLITIYEICSTTESKLVGHEFRMSDPTQMLSHWDILHTSSNPNNNATRSVLLVDGLDSLAVEILGDALKLHPLVFARHLWRNFGRDVSDLQWEGPSLSQAPLCSLADQPEHQIALDVEAYTSLSHQNVTDLHGLEDLHCIETLGELHDVQERKLGGREAAKTKESMAENLEWLRKQCDVGDAYANIGPTESTRLETPIARCVAEEYERDACSTILSTVGLCAAATICTVTPKNQQRSSRTLVLRTPGRWHKKTMNRSKGTATWTGDALLDHDPFRIEGLSRLNDAESRGSICEALCTVGDLEAAANTYFNQNDVSTLVSLSLLKASLSNVWNMTVSDHQMLLHPGKSFMLERSPKISFIPELVEVSDGCSAYLNHRCQRQQNALLLSSAVAGKLYLAVAESASSALGDYLKREMDRLKATTTRVESQLQQTEKLLTLRIDQSFRDLQITLAQTQLEESRKAIKQADTVARLTVLAFVFIPISAVCGFFGMNIVEIAVDGGFSFWVFGTTMGAVLAMTLLLAFADSIYALWSYYAITFDIMMLGTGLYPTWLLTQKIPYVFRWISHKVKGKIASGRETRHQLATITKEKIERRAEV